MGPKEEEAFQKQNEAQSTMTKKRRRRLNELRRLRERRITTTERQVSPMNAREEWESYRSWGCLFWQFIIGIALVTLPLLHTYYRGPQRRRGLGATVILGGVILIIVVCRVIAKIFRSIPNVESHTKNDRK